MGKDRFDQAACQRGNADRVMISPKKSTASLEIERFQDGSSHRRKDYVAVEEPLELRVEHPALETGGAMSVAVTMRTPGDDFELAAGFFLTEGLIRKREDIRQIAYCRGEEHQEYNVVTVQLAADAPFDPSSWSRNFFVSSSCGVCGKASLEAVEVRGCEPIGGDFARLAPSTLIGLPDALRDRQAAFDQTGGIHAAGLFSADGEPITVREDVGRHNGVDKVVGRELLEGHLPLEDKVLVVSGRASFEIMQKALMARIPVIVAVGAPSSLAVDMARRFDMTLVGFVRGTSYNVYHGSDRIGADEGR